MGESAYVTQCVVLQIFQTDLAVKWNTELPSKPRLFTASFPQRMANHSLLVTRAQLHYPEVPASREGGSEPKAALETCPCLRNTSGEEL